MRIRYIVGNDGTRLSDHENGLQKILLELQEMKSDSSVRCSVRIPHGSRMGPVMFPSGSREDPVRIPSGSR